VIGIFDSGVGGLCALKKVKELFVREDIVYFGDTGRVPYGPKSAETIKKYAYQDASFLATHGIDAMIVACGTVSSTALDGLKERFDIPIIGVIEGAARKAVSVSKNGKIAVIGTKATVSSGSFERAVKEQRKDVETYAVACPLFVPLVENGFVSEDDGITAAACEHYLRSVKEFGADTLILGCTHFPIISGAISSYLPGVELIDCAAEAAELLRERYSGKQGENGKVEYYVSDDPDAFCSLARTFLDSDVNERVRLIDIEKYS